MCHLLNMLQLGVNFVMHISKTQKLVSEGLVTVHGVNFTMGAMDVSVVQLVVTTSGYIMQKNPPSPPSFINYFYCNFLGYMYIKTSWDDKHKFHGKQSRLLWVSPKFMQNYMVAHSRFLLIRILGYLGMYLEELYFCVGVIYDGLSQ